MILAFKLYQMKLKIYKSMIFIFIALAISATAEAQRMSPSSLNTDRRAQRSAVNSINPTCYSLLSKVANVSANRPLPFRTQDSINETHWLHEYQSRYLLSFNYNFVANTPAPAPVPHLSNDWNSNFLVDGVMVTGSMHYPTDLVLRNLGLSVENPELPRDELVLDVGSGFSDLPKTLNRRGYRIHATDIWYGLNPDDIENISFLGTDHLYEIEGDANYQAADATALPFQTASIGTVISHHVLNNLDKEKQDLALQEMFRVLAPGGVIRLAVLGAPDQEFGQLVQRFTGIEGVTVETTFHEQTWNYGGRQITAVSTLYIISKPAEN